MQELLTLGTLCLEGGKIKGYYPLKRQQYIDLLVPRLPYSGILDESVAYNLAELINHMNDGMSCYPPSGAAKIFTGSRVSQVGYAFQNDISEYGIDSTLNYNGKVSEHPEIMTWQEFCEDRRARKIFRDPTQWKENQEVKNLVLFILKKAYPEKF